MKISLKHAARILDAWLPSKTLYDRTPGLSVGIVYKGKLAYARGFGFADIEKRIRSTPDTCYRIASISKTFTAIAILQLAERGKLRLNDPIKKHLEWVDGDLKNITIRQLLSHTGGMTRDGNTPHWTNDRFPDLKTLEKSVAETDLVASYRNRFKYSNFGFALLGQVIERVSGMKYDEYVMKSIIKKIGMRHTKPDLTLESIRWLAKGYERPILGRKRRSFRHVPTHAYASATGFLSNVPDLAKYLSALSMGGRPLSITIQKEMTREVARTGTAGGKDGYGLGCMIREIRKHKVIGHGGSFAGFRTRMELDVKNDLGVIVLSNSIDGSPKEISKGIFETIYDLPGILNRYGKRKIKGLEKCEGIYRNRWRDVAVVSMGNCLLAFDPRENSPVGMVTILTEKGPGRFLINSKDVFDRIGEEARFRGKKLMWGGMPYDKIAV